MERLLLILCLGLQGKTLAFVLPILESLTQNGVKNLQKGRTPNVIVLAPTRELAKQVSLLRVKLLRTLG
jgi:superfamily II DNA/RNA helicase